MANGDEARWGWADGRDETGRQSTTLFFFFFVVLAGFAGLVVVSACLFCLFLVFESEKKVEREETRQDFLTNREKKRERKEKIK